MFVILSFWLTRKNELHKREIFSYGQKFCNIKHFVLNCICIPSMFMSRVKTANNLAIDLSPFALFDLFLRKQNSKFYDPQKYNLSIKTYSYINILCSLASSRRLEVSRVELLLQVGTFCVAVGALVAGILIEPISV